MNKNLFWRLLASLFMSNETADLERLWTVLALKKEDLPFIRRHFSSFSRIRSERNCKGY